MVIVKMRGKLPLRERIPGDGNNVSSEAAAVGNGLKPSWVQGS
jgi:hypothetical protein